MNQSIEMPGSFFPSFRKEMSSYGRTGPVLLLEGLSSRRPNLELHSARTGTPKTNSTRTGPRQALVAATTTKKTFLMCSDLPKKTQTLDVPKKA